MQMPSYKALIFSVVMLLSSTVLSFFDSPPGSAMRVAMVVATVVGGGLFAYFLQKKLEEVGSGQREQASLAAQKILHAMWLYPNYRLDSRGNLGFMMDAIELLRPDIALAIRQDNLDWHEALKRFFPEDDEEYL